MVKIHVFGGSDGTVTRSGQPFWAVIASHDLSCTSWPSAKLSAMPRLYEEDSNWDIPLGGCGWATWFSWNKMFRSRHEKLIKPWHSRDSHIHVTRSGQPFWAVIASHDLSCTSWPSAKLSAMPRLYEEDSNWDIPNHWPKLTLKGDSQIAKAPNQCSQGLGGSG